MVDGLGLCPYSYIHLTTGACSYMTHIIPLRAAGIMLYGYMFKPGLE
jgi:hypothetical protein